MITMRLASKDDIARILQLRHQASEWLKTIGSDQWSDSGIGDTEFLRRVESSIRNSETWVAEENRIIVGTIAVDQWADPNLWTDEELQESLIVHRMIIDRGFTKRSIGSFMMDHAENIARAAERKYLRLDAWTTNRNLHHYYIKAGFRHVRVEKGGVSTALFEREVRQAPDSRHEDPKGLALS